MVTMRSSALAAGFLLFASSAAVTFAQSAGNSGTVRGSVQDQSGAVVANATIEIENPISHYTQAVHTDAQGSFQLSNLPLNNYHLVASDSGFQSVVQDVDVRSSVPVVLKIDLKLGATATTVEVVAAGGDLVETDSTTHTDVDRGLFEKLPLESASSSLSALVTNTTPGVSADSNGLFHGLGDHASNSFSLDGQPISDQQSKVFSNQIPLDAVQSLEVIEGAPPAEYGDKTSLVIVATTRSGLGATTPHGDITASYGTFGTGNGGVNLAYGGQNWGNFISANGLQTGRFLDGPEFQTLHDHGNEENVFDRFDLNLSPVNTLSLNLGFTRSWFQTPNSYDAQNATAWSGLIVDNGGLGPNGLPVGSADQRSKIATFNVAPTWNHTVNANTVLTLGGFFRQDQYNYYPSDNPFADFSPGVQTQTIGQNRRLTDAGARASLSYVKGIHNIKIGGVYQQTFITERDHFGIVDPTFNAACLNADGSADTDPAITSSSQCSGTLQANPSYNSVLTPYDLTRTGALGLYSYFGHSDIKELGVYLQDTITIKNLTLNLGLRGDKYNGITRAGQAEPRVGAAYKIKATNTVLRVSYARTMETPFNENLVLASNGCNDPVINALETLVQGYACLTSPLRPSTRNEYHVGIQQAFGRYLVIDAQYIWKYTDRAFDFSVLGNTPITYPIEWAKSKIPGYTVRASVPNFHGFTAFVVMSSVAARFYGPQVSGIGATPSSLGDTSVFRIDHDELFNQTTHLQYQFKKTGPWLGFNWRYDSGLVAGPLPCAGGNCANGPNGSDSIVDFSGLTPDQQYQAGLSCAGVRATPTTPISATGLCAASQYTSSLVNIPAAGTEDDDHKPPRIAPRNLFDIAVGDDNLFKGEKYKWSARLTVVNLTDKEALYNFLSTFSGTHYVTPRTVTATIGFHF